MPLSVYQSLTAAKGARRIHVKAGNGRRSAGFRIDIGGAMAVLRTATAARPFLDLSPAAAGNDCPSLSDEGWRGKGGGGGGWGGGLSGAVAVVMDGCSPSLLVLP